METNKASPGGVYTDIQGLNKIKSQSLKDNSGALRQAAVQFEQIFMNMMLKSMRDANESFADKDSPFSSSDTKFYQGMYDQQIALDLSNRGGLGLADVIVEQLGGQARKPTVKADAIGSSFTEKKSFVFDIESRRVASLSFDRVNNILKQGVKIQPSNQSVGGVGKNEPVEFKSPQDFVAHLLPEAINASKKLNVSPSILIAQAALETGWGKYITLTENGSSNNLFNIKKGSTNHPSVAISADEYIETDGTYRKVKVVSDFRVYNSFRDSFNDYARLISEDERYTKALSKAHSPEEYLVALQDAGYATDPNYATKINRILRMEEVRGAL